MRKAPDVIADGRLRERAGDLEGAEQAYREAIGIRSDHSEAWYLLGTLMQARGRLDQAAECFRRVIEIDPYMAEAYNGLGLVHVRKGERADALGCFERAVRVRPGYSHAHNNLANVYKELGRFDQALAGYREAVRLDPTYADAHNNLGNLLRELGRFGEAEISCREAVRLRPEHAAARNNLGAVLSGLGRFEEALESFREAARLDPNMAEARNNLGAALAELGRPEEAVSHFREAVTLAPAYAEAHKNLAGALRDLGRPEEALESCRAALRVQPDDAVGIAQMGLTLVELARTDEALEAYNRALALEPDRPETRRSRALCWLLRGDYERGWPEYEWRWRCKDLPARPFPRPEWDGGPLGGRTILLHAEQGLGDTIQFIRYARLVQEHGGRVVAAVQRPLMRLLAGVEGIDQLVAQGDRLPTFDVHAPLLSLPRILHHSPADAPSRVPYLKPEPPLVEFWRRELASLRGLKVGIAWQGSPKYRKDRQRSFPVSHLAPLAAIPGVRLVSLQKGLGSEQLQAYRAEWRVLDLAPRLDESTGPFADTAAVIANLDLVVACDSAVAHLAGALGVPVWIVQPFVPDWRWGLVGETSPWYPTARLFRQTRPGDWSFVFEGMVREMKKTLATEHTERGRK